MFYEDADLPEQITVTEDVLKDSGTLIVSRGLTHMHQMREALVTHFAEEYARDEDEAFADDKDMLEARRTTAELNDDTRVKKERERAGLWQQLSGLYPSTEARMSPNERAQRIAGLLKDVERLVRFELKRNSGSRKDAKAQRTERDEENCVVENFLARPAANWDPLRAVCFHLGISQCKLSAFSREILGVSAQEIVDQIRMESVRAELKSRLKAFAMNFCSRTPHPRPLSHKGRGENGDGSLADEIWAALKKSRKAPHFHRTSWADNLGFSSYARFFRACVLKFHVTPHELEMEILEEIAEACETPDSNGNGGHEEHEEGRKEYEENDSNGIEVVKRE